PHRVRHSDLADEAGDAHRTGVGALVERVLVERGDRGEEQLGLRLAGEARGTLEGAARSRGLGRDRRARILARALGVHASHGRLLSGDESPDRIAPWLGGRMDLREPGGAGVFFYQKEVTRSIHF